MHQIRDWKDYLLFSTDWCVSNSKGPLVWDIEPWAPVEHVVHEFCHAYLLNLNPAMEDLSDVIAEELNRPQLEGIDYLEQFRLDQERETLSIEYYVCQGLGITALTKDDFEGMAEAQGVVEGLDLYFVSGDMVEKAHSVIQHLDNLMLEI